MKEITIVSGKGGAGKTSITAALAAVATNAVFCDNDVDASDLHLFLQPDYQQSHPFVSGHTASIDTDLCSTCGICYNHCRFGAIAFDQTAQTYRINDFLCEGCRLCEKICPSQSIVMLENSDNQWYVSNTRFGKLVHAKMKPGEENSGKLVSLIRKEAKAIGSDCSAEFLLNDGPPGIGCSTISSITGTDFVLLVIEPTVAGIHDGKRLVTLAQSFGVSMGAVINKYDLSEENTLYVEEFLRMQNIPLFGKIAFDTIMIDALIAGKTVVEHNNQSALSKTIYEIWDQLKQALGDGR